CACDSSPALHSFPTRRSSDLSLYTSLAAGRSLPILGERGWATSRSKAIGTFRTRAAQTLHTGIMFIAWPTSARALPSGASIPARSEEHTSELQSRENLVCRLL